MSKKRENLLKKGRAMFNLVGEARISDYTYKIDEVSQSGWQYNSLNLGIDCGNGNVVYANMMGGFSTVRDTVLYVNSKEDFMDRYEIDFDDRFIDSILEGIHQINFIRVGIEKDTSGKTFTKRFLSEYDAIAYIKEHLEEGMVINVKGDLKYSIYNENIQIKKEIKSIFLSKAEPENYKATFVQSILIGEDAVGKLDKEKGTFPVNAYVVDYTKMYGDKEVKTNIPFYREFELEINNEKPNTTKAFIEKFFKVKKDEINEVIVEGNIVEGQQLKEISPDDIPEDIKELIELGIYKEEEILGKMTVVGDRVRRYIITKPYVQMKGETEEDRKPVIFVEKGKFKPSDLVFDFMYEDDEGEDIDSYREDTAEEIEDDLDWLNALG